MSKQLLKAIIMAQPHRATASGSLIHIDRAEFADAQRCVVSFSPVQSGSGDPSPSNVRPITGWTGVNVVRTGRNLFGGTINNLALTAYGSIVSDTTCRGVYCRVIGGQTYTVSRKTIEGNRFRVAATVVEPQVGTSCYVLSGGENDTNLNVTVTVPSGYNYLFVYLSNQSDNCSADNYMVELGSTATAYAPYNGVTVPVNWNLINDTLRKITGTTIYIGNTTDGYRIWLTTGVYTFSAQMLNGADYGAYIRGQTASGATVIWTAGTNTTSGTVTITKDDYYRINFYAEGIVAANIGACQLERGAIATPYTPYVGTVYGGSVDLTSGTLTVTHGMFTIDSTGWYNEGSNENRQAFSLPSNTTIGVKPAATANDVPNAISTIFKPMPINAGTMPYYLSFLRNYPHRLLITFPPNTYADTTEMRAAMAGVPIVYELETPLTYQLTPTDIKLLRGENNIFSNSNGNIILTYWAH